MQAVIAQIVQEFLDGVAELDETQKRLFLNWLASHSRQVDCAGLDEPVACLQDALPRWLGSLAPADLLWEYRLILHEIEWCAELDMDVLERFLSEQA